MKIALHDRLIVALGTAMACLAVSAAAETDARISIISSYVHRGLEHSQSSPAYQASLEYQTAGWFAGVWASTVDYGYDNRSSEVDYYLGYGRRMARNLALEATLIHYTYQGSTTRDQDWSELQLSAYVADRWTFTWGVADNWWGTDERSRFLEATYRYPLPARFMLDATAGYQLTGRAAGIDYGYAETGISRRVGDFALRAGYVAVESKARERFSGFAENQWVASLTWEP